MPTFDLRLLPATPDGSYSAYRARTGPDAVARARALSPAAVLEEIQRSGLRGRGGAGFPTGTKWQTIFRHPCPTRFVVCNAAEGEPGTFKDRFLLRQSPYATLEGMLIAAHLVGAKSLHLGIKASFTKEIARLDSALAEMGAAGALGGLEVKIARGPEEYLFGEEKALLEVIEGNEPLPREATSPPHEEGLFATVGSPNPALVNNAETFAHVPAIVRFGAAAFRELGTQDTPGTLLFTVSGDVRRPGVFEAPAGISLRDLFHDLAGGPRPGRTLKAALSGVSSGVIPADRFDTRADFGSLQLVGSGLGSAGFIALDDQASVPRVAQAAARFLYVESCNQCSACKAGLRLASQALDRALSGAGKPQDLAWVRSGALSAPQGSRCALPAGAAALLPSLLDRYGSEFEAERSAAGAVPWPIPKFSDYDEATHTFTVDERQGRKQPNWTYEDSPAAPPAKAPRNLADLQTHLQLPFDLLEALAERADAEGVDLHELAEDILRAWLPKRTKAGAKDAQGSKRPPKGD
ncbi:MAG: NADH-ubiquinone oxidoreductase-F iron-sulfur binding region domain-containing protein [Myxococcales bacterium]